MKTSIIAGVLVAVLGVANVADACHGKKSKGVKGKITGVSKNALSLSVALPTGGSQVYTVKYTAGTTFAGARTHSISSSLVGASATVVGAETGKMIKASEIVISE